MQKMPAHQYTQPDKYNYYCEEVKKFMSDRFGLFIHWGLYSVLGGRWKDRELKQNQLGEGIMYYMQIPLEEYSKIQDAFNPLPGYAEGLVQAAKKAGMRYIIITTKHHDGFCLFKTSVNRYNAFNATGRDLIEELADACRHYGVKLGFYYSHTLDWSEKHAPGSIMLSTGRASDYGNTWDFDNTEEKDFSLFLYGKVFPQVKELLTNYGDVLLMWFDFPHNITPVQSRELYDFVKSIQPACLVNSRIGNGYGDYFDMGDNQILSVPMGIPQQCLITLNDTWGFKFADNNWKKPEQIIELLIRSISCGANLLMNVGPEGSGLLKRETAEIMDEVSAWVSENSEAVYGTACNPFKTTFDWGYVTRKENRLYLYMKNNSEEGPKGINGGDIVINGLLSVVEEITDISGRNQLGFTQADIASGETRYSSLKITMPKGLKDLCFGSKRFPVFCIKCKNKIKDDGKIYQNGDILYLHPIWAEKRTADHNADKVTELRIENNIYDRDNGRYGLSLDRIAIVTGWQSDSEYLQWEAIFTKQGMYQFELLSLPGRHLGNERCGVTIEIYSVDDHLRTGQNHIDRHHMIVTDVLKENHNYQLSRTGSGNIRIGSVCGKSEIDGVGVYIIRLRRNQSSEIKLPLAALKIMRLGSS